MCIRDRNTRNNRIKEVDIKNTEIISKNRAGIEKLVLEIVKMIIQTGCEEGTL